MTIFAKDIKGRFAVARVGIKNYEDEKKLWNLRDGCKLTFCHILKRIDEEIKRAKQSKWQCDDLKFYPYVFGREDRKPPEKLVQKFAGLQGPIEIFFIPTRDDEDDYTDEFPDSKDIEWKNDDDISQCIAIEKTKCPLPDCIRIGGSKNKYTVLLVDEFDCCKKEVSDVLDCSGAHCKGIGQNILLSGGWRAFDLFENGNTEEGCNASKFMIVATAKLISPYWGWALPFCS